MNTHADTINRITSESTTPRVSVGSFDPPHVMLMLTIDRPDLLTPEELDAKLAGACVRLRGYHREILEECAVR
jgi:hypothetical protein